MLSLAPLSVFEMANLELGRAFYDVRVLSEGGGQIRTSIGAAVDTQPFARFNFDTVIFGGAV